MPCWKHIQEINMHTFSRKAEKGPEMMPIAVNRMQCIRTLAYELMTTATCETGSSGILWALSSQTYFESGIIIPIILISVCANPKMYWSLSISVSWQKEALGYKTAYPTRIHLINGIWVRAEKFPLLVTETRWKTTDVILIFIKLRVKPGIPE